MTIDSFQVKSFHTLEFNKVCEKLASFAVSDAAKDAALHLMPTDSIREAKKNGIIDQFFYCLLYTSPSPRD